MVSSADAVSSCMPRVWLPATGSPAASRSVRAATKSMIATSPARSGRPATMRSLPRSRSAPCSRFPTAAAAMAASPAAGTVTCARPSELARDNIADHREAAGQLLCFCTGCLRSVSRPALAGSWLRSISRRRGEAGAAGAAGAP